MKAIKIDAITQTVSEITIDIWSEIAPAIGCDLFDCVCLSPTETLYCDDEGLLKNPEHFIQIRGYPQPLAGSALILGSDEEGESVDTKLTIEQVQKMVTFL
jgi:hypothetical protein